MRKKILKTPGTINMVQTGTVRGIIAVLLSGCLWGSVGIFARTFDGLGYNPVSIVFVRLFFAFIIVFVILHIIGKRELLRIHLKDLWCFVGTGISSAILLGMFFSMSTIMNSLSLAAILISTSPIFVVFLSVPFFSERITSVKLQALVICFAGCVLTSGAIDDNLVFYPLGIIIGLLSGFGYALYSIMSRFALNRGYDPLTINVYSFGIGSLACVPGTHFALIAATVSADPWKMFIFLLVHTLCTSLLPYLLYTYGMKFMDTGKASILVSIEPVAATVFGIALYSEIPSVLSVIGIILILFAISLLNIKGGLRALQDVLSKSAENK